MVNRKRASRSSYTGDVGFISPERTFHSYHTPRARYHPRPALGPPSARSWMEDQEEGKEEGEEVGEKEQEGEKEREGRRCRQECGVAWRYACWC